MSNKIKLTNKLIWDKYLGPHSVQMEPKFTILLQENMNPNTLEQKIDKLSADYHLQ